MPPRVIVFAAALGAASASANEGPATSWREALALEFELTAPSPPPPPPENSPLRPGVPMPDFAEDESDVVLLEPMTIVAHRTHRELDQVFAREHALREARQLSWKGGPLIERKIGPAHVGVYSVLFIPVAVVGTISW